MPSPVQRYNDGLGGQQCAGTCGRWFPAVNFIVAGKRVLLCPDCTAREKWARRMAARPVVYVGGHDPATDRALRRIRAQTLAERPVFA